MATQKKVSSNTKTNEAVLKARVKELEEEVANLKRRLDELRKAKNTTIMKREREIIEVGNPFGKRNSRSEAKTEDLQKKLDDAELQMEKDMDNLRKQFAAEMETVKSQLAKNACNHGDEITRLRKKNSELEADNAALLMENSDLKDRVTSLISELSLKEAHWCELEEKLKLEMKKSFGDKYKDWMEETEKRISELQETNALLRSYLEKQRSEADPAGRDSKK
ncbi:hypothetical protein CHS0354_013923 [Potamilus streckersoni]|uniref:Uncharacterized protein n=1 Tax=Potamilus streckersoni TaxID=2493646 RepID=A0AAE0VLB5_9BIVA|nr:hypothetical protein CHS0354_013923 [Potamilus streckersoni]